jgi:hypothetical protein
MLLRVPCASLPRPRPPCSRIGLATSASPTRERERTGALCCTASPKLQNLDYERAARAFREAQRLDPRFVTAYLGEAMGRNHLILLEQDPAGADESSNEWGRQRHGRRRRLRRALLTAVEPLYGSATNTSGHKDERDRLSLAEMRRRHAAYSNDADSRAS